MSQASFGRRRFLTYSGLAGGVLLAGGGLLARQLTRLPTPSSANGSLSTLASVTGKKLIETGWDIPTASFVRDNIKTMEQRPFDGISLTFDHGVPLGFEARAWTQEEIQLDVLQAIQWERFTDNFFLVWIPSKEQMDWFSDQRWETITNNMKLLSSALRAARAKGIFFDPEFYFATETTSPWLYTKTLYPEKDFTAVAQQVRQRGAQFIQALQSQTPNLVILCFMLLTIVNAQTEGNIENLPSSEYALLPAFLNGMLDAAHEGVTVIDGNEGAYYYDETTKYAQGYDYSYNQASWLIAPENRQRAQTQMRVGFAASFEYPYALWQDNRGQSDHYKQVWVEHNVYHALLTSDTYVWFYSEQIDFWRDTPTGLNGKQFSAVQNTQAIAQMIEAITTARQKLEQSLPLGFDMVKRDIWNTSVLATMQSTPSLTLQSVAGDQSVQVGSEKTFEAKTQGENIDHVEFFVNALKVGEVHQAPYRLTVKMQTKGITSVIARVFFQQGHITSNPLFIAVL